MAYTYAGHWGPEPFFRTDGSILSLATIYVYAVGTSLLATTYTDRTKATTTGGTFGTDSDGNGSFYADPGRYDLVYKVLGVEKWRITVTVQADPVEADDDTLLKKPATDGISGDVLVRTVDAGEHTARWAPADVAGHPNLAEHDTLGLVTKTAGDIAYGRLAANNVWTGKHEINGGGWAQPFDADLFVAGALRTNPADLTQAIYAVHRVSGNMGAQVHDASAFELRVYNVSNASFLNAVEASAVIVGPDASTIPDLRAITANAHWTGAPTGTVDSLSLIRAQAAPALPAGLTVTALYGLYVEQQTRGTTNWSIYAPSGQSLFGGLHVSMGAGNQRVLTFSTVDSGRWRVYADSTAESGANAGSDFVIERRADDGSNLGAVMTVARSTGVTAFAGNVTVPTITASGNVSVLEQSVLIRNLTNSGTHFSLSKNGPRWNSTGLEQTTVGAAGAAAALPANPTKYLRVQDSAGTILIIPAYAAS